MELPGRWSCRGVLWRHRNPRSIWGGASTRKPLQIATPFLRAPASSCPELTEPSVTPGPSSGNLLSATCMGSPGGKRQVLALSQPPGDRSGLVISTRTITSPTCSAP